MAKKEECEKYIEFLKLLGWHNIVLYAAKTWVYEYNQIEFSLVEIKDYGYNFEAEIMSEENDIEKYKAILTKELRVLGLNYFNEADLEKQCNLINNKKELQFDLNKIDFKDIQERFKEFF